MQNFKSAYDNIRNGERIALRNKIMKQCGWNNRSQFVMAKNGTRPPSDEHAKIIRREFANLGINADNGLPLVK